MAWLIESNWRGSLAAGNFVNHRRPELFPDFPRSEKREDVTSLVVEYAERGGIKARKPRRG